MHACVCWSVSTINKKNVKRTNTKIYRTNGNRPKKTRLNFGSIWTKTELEIDVQTFGFVRQRKLNA